jgi:hypothetical protein
MGEMIPQASEKHQPKYLMNKAFIAADVTVSAAMVCIMRKAPATAQGTICSLKGKPKAD